MNDDYRYPHSLVSLPVVQAAGTAPPPASQATAAGPVSDVPSPTQTAQEPDAVDPTRFVEQRLIEGKVIEALRQIYDPEIPIDIYELGLIYDVKVQHDRSVKIKMTLTAPACPVAGSLPGEVERKVESIPEVKSADVELVWDPPWSRDRMSEAALLQLGML